jgi:hypothetical protein
MTGEGPLPGWCDATCVVCPAQVLGPGGFDVTDRPGPDSRYDPSRGYRIEVRSGTAVCVHPYRVGLPPGAYASAGQPLPAPTLTAPAPSPVALQLPVDVVDLEGWLIAVLRTSDPARMATALNRAEATASARFTSREVVTAMRRVLAHELTGH